MKLQELSDEKVLHIFSQQKDPVIFEELVRCHQKRIVSRCYSYLKNRDDAQDVAQEVLIRLFTKADNYNSDAPFDPWLNTIIRNRCMDHIRQDKRELHEEVSRKIEESLLEDYDTEEVLKPTLEVLEELLEQVTSEEKLILFLKYRRKWSIQAIAQSLNVNENTVKSKIKRSWEKLQRLFLTYSNN